METVHIFDIATSTWFAQSTTSHSGYPAGRSGFCSVVASAQDGSSHNIYIYGGVTPPDPNPNNGVYVLTLPAFLWVTVYPSVTYDADTDIRQSQNHRCQKVQEKYMVAYRGTTSNSKCVSDKALKKFQGMAIYDMSSLVWTTKVELNQEYSVPPVLSEIIGGK